MGFFGKKKINNTPDDDKEKIIKSDLGLEIEKLEGDIREKQEQLGDITQKITTVKEEYNSTVGSLMLVKKEFNQKKMELDIIQREYRETRERSKKAELIKDTKTIDEFNKTKGDHLKIKDELDEFTIKHDKVKKQIEQEQSNLHNIKKQQVESEKELDEANARLYNAKTELDKKDNFQDTNILTPSEKEFIGVDNENQKSSAGIIEAASAIVGSLKSKLSMTQKELDAIQTSLEKEREDHKNTRKELEKLKNINQ